MSQLQLSLYSPARQVLHQHPVNEVCLQTIQGQVEVLPGHADYASVLKPGVFSYCSEQKTYYGVITYGFVEVSGAEVSVLAEIFESQEEIDLERAEEALAKATQKLQDTKDMEEADIRKYQLKLQRALARKTACDS